MGRAGQGLREEGRARDTHWKEAEEVREALRMQLAGLERPEAEGQRLEWKQAWVKAGCSLRVWAEGCGEVGAVWYWLGRCSGPWVFTAPGESRSRLRWGLSRLRKDKGSSQPDLSASVQEDLGHQYVRSESGKRPAG